MVELHQEGSASAACAAGLFFMVWKIGEDDQYPNMSRNFSLSKRGLKMRPFGPFVLFGLYSNGRVQRYLQTFERLSGLP